jgi:hypothetical protein
MDFFKQTEALFGLGDGPHNSIEPGAHSLAYSYHRAIPEWVFGETLPVGDSERLWKTRVAYGARRLKRVGFRHEVYHTGQFFVARASIPASQGAFWGATQKAIDDGRVSLKDLRVSLNNINLMPHFVG